LTPPGPPEELDDAYRRIFAEAGIDMTGPTAKVAHAIVAQSEALRATFITALDTWASRLPHDRPELAESWTNLIETASAADIDPWRNRLRRAMLRRDRETIEEMANGLDAAAHAPESILLLGQGLHIVRIGRPAEIRVLLEGFRHHPGDFWINFTIVHLSLTDPEPGNALELAERHARIAVALRPDNFDAWGMLGAALLLGRKDLEEAKFAFRTALEKTKIRGPREHLRAALLMAEGKPEEGRRILDELPDAGPPWFRRLSGRPDGPDRPPRPDRDRPPPPDRR
jgi:tetratricopeptide (TPR) repeat protein